MEAEYIHAIIEVEIKEASDDSVNIRGTEDRNGVQASDTRSYVTDKYAGSLQSKKDVVQGAASHHKKPVAKYYCHTKGW